jgi:hypothetical protein
LAVEAREPIVDQPRPAPKAPAPSVELPAPNPPQPPRDAPLVVAARHTLEGRTDLAAADLQTLDPANREVVLRLLPVLTRAATNPIGPKHPHGCQELADQLQAEADRLAAHAPLRIDKAIFCRHVSRFGRYDPRPEGAAYAPWELVTLYLEIGNAPCQPAIRPGDGAGFNTSLACRFEVRDANNQPVPQQNRDGQTVEAIIETRHDFTRSPVRDYFLIYSFPAPGTAGNYTVQTELRDPASGRSATRTVPLRVQ